MIVLIIMIIDVRRTVNAGPVGRGSGKHLARALIWRGLHRGFTMTTNGRIFWNLLSFALGSASTSSSSTSERGYRRLTFIIILVVIVIIFVIGVTDSPQSLKFPIIHGRRRWHDGCQCRRHRHQWSNIKDYLATKLSWVVIDNALL